MKRQGCVRLLGRSSGRSRKTWVWAWAGEWGQVGRQSRHQGRRATGTSRRRESEVSAWSREPQGSRAQAEGPPLRGLPSLICPHGQTGLRKAQRSWLPFTSGQLWWQCSSWAGRAMWKSVNKGPGQASPQDRNHGKGHSGTNTGEGARPLRR